MKWMTRSTRTPIGIDLDSRTISAVQLSRRGKAWNVEAGTVIPRVGAPGTPNPEEVRRLTDVLYRQGFTGHKIILAVPNEMLLTGVMDLPPIGSGAPLDQI